MMICLLCLVAMIKNASISSSCCVSNNVEETEDSMGQDKALNGASSNSSPSSTHGSHLCLMARSSNHSDDKVNSEDDDDEEDNYEDYTNSLNKKGEMIFHALRANKNVHSNFFEIMTCVVEGTKLCKKLEETLEMLCKNEREDAIEKAALSQALEEEEETRVSLEEKLESIEELNN